MKNKLLVDRLKIGNPKFLSDSLNLLSDMVDSGKRAKLLAPIRATHSGYLLNRRVYPGYSMRDAVETWVSPYEKPVLVHHDGLSDAIGRIKGAKYYQLKSGLEFERDYQNPDTGDKLGSGFVVLDTEVTDPDAIQKILDGRYLTVSTSQVASAAICSACAIDWFGEDAEECGHTPGKPFFDKKTGETISPYLIQPISANKECSFVNDPAQPNVKILSKELVEDSFTLDNMFVNDGVCTLDYLLLQDFNGNSVNLLLSEGMKDQMPNEAVNLRAKRVFSFTSKESDMSKKTSDEADKKLEELKELADKAKTEAQKEIKPEEKAKEEVKKEDAKVEDKKEEPKAEVVSNAALTSALEDMTKVKTDLTNKNKELQTALETKSSVVDSMTQEIARLKAENVKQLARQLAITKVNLNKPGTDGITSKDKLDAYVEQLAKRTAESLQDSLNDLLPELEDAMKTRKSIGMFVNSKVENPVQGGQDNTNKDAKTPSTPALKGKKEALDELN